MNPKIYALLLLFSNLISAFSQTLLKKSALEEHKNIIFEYLNLKVIVAYSIFFIAIFVDLTALKYVSVSFVPVIETSSYVFIILLGRIVFKEKINLQQAIGILLILTGIAIFVV